MNLQETMQIDLDAGTIELLYESIQFRLENDNHLMYLDEKPLGIWNNEQLKFYK